MEEEWASRDCDGVEFYETDPARLPVRFALRIALESSSVANAASRIEMYGVAASAHILMADGKDAVGLEVTKSSLRGGGLVGCLRMKLDCRGRFIGG